MSNRGAEHVVIRNEFYRDSFRKVAAVAVALGIATVIEAGVIGYLVTRPVQTRYFAADNGRIIPLVPLDQPYVSKSSLLRFAQECAQSAYTFDFQNYKSQLQNVSKCFTNAGYQSFLQVLGNSGNLDAVKSKRLVVSAVALNAPVINREGQKNGVYAWEVKMPMQVAYQSSSERSTQNFMVTMVISRMPTVDNPEGIGIEQFLMAENH